MRPGGILEEMVRWMTETAISPQPLLALGAAIAVIGTAAGRKYRAETDMRTNVYIVALGPSGCGKDHPRQCAKAALEAAGLADWIGGEELASGTGVLSAVARHPACLFLVDEFG